MLLMHILIDLTHETNLSKIIFNYFSHSYQNVRQKLLNDYYCDKRYQLFLVFNERSDTRSLNQIYFFCHIRRKLLYCSNILDFYFPF